MANAEVRGTFTKGGMTVKTRSWTAATENLAVTELSVEGGTGVSAGVKLFPEPTVLKDNDKPINLGQEQHGKGRWYFNGLIDEVHLFDRGLSAGEIKALAGMQPVRPGLVRHWGFEAEEGSNPIDTPIKYVLAPPVLVSWMAGPAAGCCG